MWRESLQFFDVGNKHIYFFSNTIVGILYKFVMTLKNILYCVTTIGRLAVNVLNITPAPIMLNRKNTLRNNHR